jgi:hypothetical protein
MVSSELRLVVMDVLYRNENRMRLADFEKTIAREGHPVGISELRELQSAQDVAEVDGMWVALRYNELFDKTNTYVGRK